MLKAELTIVEMPCLTDKVNGSFSNQVMSKSTKSFDIPSDYICNL